MPADPTRSWRELIAFSGQNLRGSRGGDTAMSECAGAPPAEFEDLNRRGHEAAEAGRLEEALRLFDEMVEWARQHAAGELLDLALCNRAAVAVVLGRGETELPLLRKILLRSE